MKGLSNKQLQQAWQLREEGYDPMHIATVLGVRPDTAQRFASLWEAHLAEPPAWHAGLPERLANRLQENGIASLERLREAWTVGGLQKPGRYPHIGATSIEQIRRWLASRDNALTSSDVDTPVIAHLSREALEALDAMVENTGESRCEIINRLILTAGKPGRE